MYDDHVFMSGYVLFMHDVICVCMDIPMTCHDSSSCSDDDHACVRGCFKSWQRSWSYKLPDISEGNTKPPNKISQNEVGGWELLTNLAFDKQRSGLPIVP